MEIERLAAIRREKIVMSAVEFEKVMAWISPIVLRLRWGNFVGWCSLAHRAKSLPQSCCFTMPTDHRNQDRLYATSSESCPN